jgi:hypothetical protein
MEQWILILMIFSFNENVTMTSISGFETYSACILSGEAWTKTKRELDRDFVCIPAKAK